MITFLTIWCLTGALSFVLVNIVIGIKPDKTYLYFIFTNAILGFVAAFANIWLIIMYFKNKLG